MSASRKNGDRQGAPGVLLVAETGASGGIARYCVDVAELLGDSAAVACLCEDTNGGCDTCWLARQSRARNIRLFSVSMGAKRLDQGCRGLAALWRGIGRPLLHVNGRRGNFVAQSLAVALPGFSFVTTVHGVLGLHDRRNLVYRLIDLAACHRASAVIAVSADTRRRLLSAGSPAGRTVCISNGLSATDSIALGRLAESRVNGSAAGRSPRIGFLGRLSQEKGIEGFTRIAERLHEVEPEAEYVVAGDGPLKALFAREMRGLASAGVLSYLAEVENAAEMLSRVDLLILPSRNEGMPYTLLEGMAGGCAVAGYGVGGIPEVVADRSLGVLARPGDLNGLFDSILGLVRRPDLLAQIGTRASKHVLRHFSLEARLDSLLSVYASGGFSHPGRLDAETAAEVGISRGWHRRCV